MDASIDPPNLMERKENEEMWRKIREAKASGESTKAGCVVTAAFVFGVFVGFILARLGMDIYSWLSN